MKQLIKLTSVILALFLVTACIGTAVFADENENKVEISFRVGDSTLSINGNDVTVETPYVVDGTTLVPLRVITEAFGAEVNWNGETKTVTVFYSSVEIKLAIGSKSAYINGNEIELLAAPELTNSTTMLPMRFITENFGADVTYDEATKAITVVKELTESNSVIDYSMILKSSTKEYVGDSYYNWSVKRSPRYKLVYRSFDGRKNWFEIDSIGAIYDVIIYEKGETTIDEIYNTYKDQSKYVTTNKLEKSKTNKGIEYVNFQCNDSDYYYDYRTHIYKDHIFDVILKVDKSTNKSEFLELSALSETFDFTFNSSSSEDLSDVDSNGMHIYKSKDMGIELNIPASYVVLESENQTNEVHFVDFSDSNSIEEASEITITMYSSYEGHTYKTWAEGDYNGNKNYYNPDCTTFSEILSTDIDNKEAVYYTYSVNKNDFKQTTKDVFISAGNYFYNIAVSADSSEFTALADKIYKSVVFSSVNEEELGKIIRTVSYEEPKYSEKSYQGLSFKIPDDWEIKSDTTSFMATYGANCISIISIVNTNNISLQKIANDINNSLKKYDTLIDITSPVQEIIGKNKGYKFINTMKYDKAKIIYKTYNYFIQNSNICYCITFSTHEIFDGKTFNDIKSKFLESISFS